MLVVLHADRTIETIRRKASIVSCAENEAVASDVFTLYLIHALFFFKETAAFLIRPGLFVIHRSGISKGPLQKLEALTRFSVVKTNTSLS